jgi:hypothetical protein
MKRQWLLILQISHKTIFKSNRKSKVYVQLLRDKKNAHSSLSVHRVFVPETPADAKIFFWYLCSISYIK